jgi:hypothetical protein
MMFRAQRVEAKKIGKLHTRVSEHIADVFGASALSNFRNTAASS